MFVYVFSFYVQLSSAIDQVLLLAQIWAHIDVLLRWRLWKTERKAKSDGGKGEKGGTCDPEWQWSSAGVIRGNVSDKTVH